MSDEETCELEMLLGKVHDEASFLTFINALSDDWENERRKEAKNPSSPFGPGANNWENGTIGAFLEAAHAWGEAWLNRADANRPNNNAWHRAAQILYAGKYYE